MSCFRRLSARLKGADQVARGETISAGNDAEPIPSPPKAADEAAEPTEAELKAERILFHREKVRNGPVSFRSVTNGQIRRAKERAEKREAKRNFKREVRQHLEQLRAAATLRGQLTVAGVIPTVQEFDLKRQVDATVWIVRRFGVSVERTDGPAYASF